MLSYLSRAFHDPALCLPFSQHNSDKTTDDTLCSFGDLFCPKSISSRTDFYEDYSTPEFDLTGFFEECLDAISLDSPGQADAKLSNELASTQANENSVTDLEVLKSPDYDKGKEDFELELDMLSTISIASLLKKRPKVRPVRPEVRRAFPARRLASRCRLGCVVKMGAPLPERGRISRRGVEYGGVATRT